MAKKVMYRKTVDGIELITNPLEERLSRCTASQSQFLQMRLMYGLEEEELSKKIQACAGVVQEYEMTREEVLKKYGHVLSQETIDWLRLEDLKNEEE